MDVRVGLCGWTVSQTSYVRRFPLVEVQHTFSEPPSDTVLARWRAQVPPELVRGRPAPYVLFDDLPRAGDAERFLALL